jgi:chemotaxis protein CheD
MKTNPNPDNLPVFYLHPGEVFFSKKPFLVSTVLGSCLSITMFDNRTKFGGISHCKLPNCSEANYNCINCQEQYKFVVCTIKQMIKKFEENKVKRYDLEVKIFGGADVFYNESGSNSNSIGKQNIVAAKKGILDNRLNLVAMDVGGSEGRQIIFTTNNGDIFLHRVRRSE